MKGGRHIIKLHKGFHNALKAVYPTIELLPQHPNNENFGKTTKRSPSSENSPRNIGFLRNFFKKLAEEKGFFYTEAHKWSLVTKADVQDAKVCLFVVVSVVVVVAVDDFAGFFCCLFLWQQSFFWLILLCVFAVAEAAIAVLLIVVFLVFVFRVCA